MMGCEDDGNHQISMREMEAQIASLPEFNWSRVLSVMCSVEDFDNKLTSNNEEQVSHLA